MLTITTYILEQESINNSDELDKRHNENIIKMRELTKKYGPDRDVTVKEKDGWPDDNYNDIGQRKARYVPPDEVEKLKKKYPYLKPRLEKEPGDEEETRAAEYHYPDPESMKNRPGTKAEFQSGIERMYMINKNGLGKKGEMY